MGFFDKIRGWVSVPDDDDGENISSRSSDYEGEEQGVQSVREEKQDRQADRQERQDKSRRAPARPENPGREPAQMQVVLVKPERFEEAPGIADHLNFRRTVVLNLETASKETSRRLIDFLSGAAYIKNGAIKKVATNTFIITPCNVDVTGELSDDTDTAGGIYF